MSNETPNPTTPNPSSLNKETQGLLTLIGSMMIISLIFALILIGYHYYRKKSKNE